MQTIKRYITVSFLTAFCMTLIVLTAVMSMALVFRVNDLLVRGIPARLILRVLLYGIPQLLALSIPVSVMTACLLVFGRLSADGEITAMKACGISLFQAMSGPLLLSILASLACVWINQEFAPWAHYARRSLKSSLKEIPPIELLEVGRFVQDFPGLTIYIGAKQDQQLTDVRIWDVREGEINRQVRAKSGTYRATQGGKGLELELQDVRVEPFSEKVPGAMYCKTWIVRLDDLITGGNYRKREKDMTMAELVVGTRFVDVDYASLNDRERATMRCKMRVELHKRLALSLSCFAFAVLGVPLGIRAHRRESSVGVGISLFLVFNFYLFIIVAESLVKFPMMQPHLLAWTPVVLSVVIGYALLRRNN